MFFPPFHPVPLVPLHLSALGPDDFICLGLAALILVVGTFFVRSGKKEQDTRSDPCRTRD